MSVLSGQELAVLARAGREILTVSNETVHTRDGNDAQELDDIHKMLQKQVLLDS